MSPTAARLCTVLHALDDGRQVSIEELMRAVRASKTGIRTAMMELQAEGLATIQQET